MSDQNVVIPDMTPEQQIEQLVGYVATAVHRRYRDFTDRVDVYQELYLYALGAGRAHIARWMAKEEWHRVRLALTGVGKSYCENEKAARSGYSPTDVAWYSPAELADLVPLALDPEFDGVVSSDEDTSGRRRQVDAAEGGTLLAMIADVRRALNALGWKNPGKYTGMWFDPETEDGMANLVKLSDFLGGEFPGAPGYQRGHRRAISNAAAATQIRRDTGDLVGSGA